MDDKPLVSFGMPVYNGGAYLARAVRSVLNQTYRNVELILVDDGSRDGCVEALPAELKNDSRLHVVRQENQGVLKAVDRTILESRGQFYASCAQDDYVHPRMVEYCLWALERNQADACFFFAHRISGAECDATHELPPFDRIPYEVYTARQRQEDPQGYSSAFVLLQNDGWGHFTRMDLVQRIRNDWPYYDSSVYRAHRLMKDARAVVKTSALLYYYNVGNEGSLSKKPLPARVVRYFHHDFQSLWRLFEQERKDPRLKVLWDMALRWQVQRGVKMVFNGVRRKNNQLPASERVEARKALVEMLRDLTDKGCLPLHSVGLVRWLRYLTYRKLF